MNRKHSIFGLLFGIAFQIAFAEGFLLIVRHFLAEDPEALAIYPKVRVGMYIFWAPFMINNIRLYLIDWKLERAENAGRDLAKKAVKSAVGKSAEQTAKKRASEEARERLKRKVDAEKTDFSGEQEALERERAERERANREWQEQATREQRQQNADRDRARQTEADRRRAEAEKRAAEEEKQQAYRDRIARDKYWYTGSDPKSIRRAYDDKQEIETGIGESYATGGDILYGVEKVLGWTVAGAETSVNVGAEWDKSGATKLLKITRDLVKPMLVDPMESLSRGDYIGVLKSIVTGAPKGYIGAIQDIVPTGVESVNVVLESAKTRLDLWRRGVTDPEEIKNELEREARARSTYERTGTAVRLVAKAAGLNGDLAEQIGNTTKEITSTFYTNDAVRESVAKQQAARVKKNAAPSKYLTDLRNKIREFKQTGRHIDLR